MEGKYRENQKLFFKTLKILHKAKMEQTYMIKDKQGSHKLDI